MQKKRHIFLAVLVVAGVGGLTRLSLLPHEPTYHARTVSSWLHSSLRSGMDTDPNFGYIWRGLGSNAVPFLRKALDAPPDGPLKKTYWALHRHLPDWINRHLTFDPPPSAIIRWRAAYGLGVLGDAAVPAIPDLIRLSKSDTDSFYLNGSLFLTQDFVRERALWAVGNIRQNMKPSDPLYPVVTKALIDILNGSDPHMRPQAARDLKQQYPEAAANAGL